MSALPNKWKLKVFLSCSCTGDEKSCGASNFSTDCLEVARQSASLRMSSSVKINHTPRLQIIHQTPCRIAAFLLSLAHPYQTSVAKGPHLCSCYFFFFFAYFLSFLVEDHSTPSKVGKCISPCIILGLLSTQCFVTNWKTVGFYCRDGETWGHPDVCWTATIISFLGTR